VVKYCTNETLQAAFSRLGEHRWGPPEARRYHHHWRDDSAVWHHVELPGVAGNRPKLFIDKEDNAYLIFSDTRDSRDLDPSRGNLKIMAATPEERWKDWRVIHVERGPFCNEMLGDYYRWQQEEILSVIVQELPEKPHQATSLRILEFVIGR